MLHRRVQQTACSIFMLQFDIPGVLRHRNEETNTVNLLTKGPERPKHDLFRLYNEDKRTPTLATYRQQMLCLLYLSPFYFINIVPCYPSGRVLLGAYSARRFTLNVEGKMVMKRKGDRLHSVCQWINRTTARTRISGSAYTHRIYIVYTGVDKLPVLSLLQKRIFDTS